MHTVQCPSFCLSRIFSEFSPLFMTTPFALITFTALTKSAQSCTQFRNGALSFALSNDPMLATSSDTGWPTNSVTMPYLKYTEQSVATTTPKNCGVTLDVLRYSSMLASIATSSKLESTGYSRRTHTRRPLVRCLARKVTRSAVPLSSRTTFKIRWVTRLDYTETVLYRRPWLHVGWSTLGVGNVRPAKSFYVGLPRDHWPPPNVPWGYKGKFV